MAILSNPPYGLGLKKNENMDVFMKEFGDFLKQRCSGSKAWIYFGKRELIKNMGLRTQSRSLFITESLMAGWFCKKCTEFRLLETDEPPGQLLCGVQLNTTASETVLFPSSYKSGHAPAVRAVLSMISQGA